MAVSEQAQRNHDELRTGQIIAGGQTSRSRSARTDARDLAAADGGHRDEFGHHPANVDHLEQDGPRSATLQVEPA
jgi:hypothetical protein